MKNQIFELYKPKSLTSFLDFLKHSDGSETFVYVLQHPPQNINILSASDFGYLVICLPENSQMIFSSAPFVHKMRKNLQDFKSNDYILCTGDPAVIGLSTAIASDGVRESEASSSSTVSNNIFVTGAKNTITWNRVTGALRYRVYKEQGGLFGFIGENYECIKFI